MRMIKKTGCLTFILLLFAAADLAAQSSAGQRVLVAFFSRVGASESFDGVDVVTSASLPNGNTLVAAQMLHKLTGGDVFQIVPAERYPGEYVATRDRAREELRSGTRPRLGSRVGDMAKYDVVFIGYPIWASSMPMAVQSFLAEYDWKGKTVIPFCTYGVSGIAGTEAIVKKFAVGAKVLPGLAIHADAVAGSQNAIRNWLRQIGFAPN
jgi:flavodoxin